MPDYSALSALVVRNIGDIEAAVKHAEEVIDERLFEEAGDIIARSLDNSIWFVSNDPGSQDIWFCSRSWILPDENPKDVSYWMSLTGIDGASGAAEYTWLAAFLGAGPEGATMGLKIMSRAFQSKRRWQALLKDNNPIIQDLLEAGFRQDDSQKLYYPVTLDQNLLATGFEDDDISVALQPLNDALGVCETKKLQLEKLVEYDRNISNSIK